MARLKLPVIEKPDPAITLRKLLAEQPAIKEVYLADTRFIDQLVNFLIKTLRESPELLFQEDKELKTVWEWISKSCDLNGR